MTDRRDNTPPPEDWQPEPHPCPQCRHQWHGIPCLDADCDCHSSCTRL